MSRFEVEAGSSPFTQAEQEAQTRRLRAAWSPPRGWRYWTEVNNTEVGLWYTATSFAFMLFAGVLALIVRAQPLPPIPADRPESTLEFVVPVQFNLH